MDDLYIEAEQNFSASTGLNEIITKALKVIFYTKFDPQKEIEKNLFEITYNELNKAIDKGFGEIEYGEPNYEFVQQLKSNNAIFSAFKTHKQQNDLAAMLLDDDGELRSFAEFKKAVAPITINYNANWLNTEHNTAIKRARVAAQFKEVEQSEHFKNLTWLPSTAAVPREVHKQFYNKTWKADDSFFSSHRPGDEWGCDCGLKATDSKPNGGKVSKKDTPKPAKGLDNNPSKDGAIFSKNHPYIKDAKRGAKKAVNDFTKTI